MRMENYPFNLSFLTYNIKELYYVISMLPSSFNQMGLQYLFVSTILYVLCGLDRHLEFVDDFHHSV